MKYIPITNEVWKKLKSWKTKAKKSTYSQTLKHVFDQIEDLVEEKSNFDDYSGDW